MRKRVTLFFIVLLGVTAGIASLVVLKESRLTGSYYCAADRCYKVVAGKRVWITDWAYEKRWRLENARIARLNRGWLDDLAMELYEWKDQRRWDEYNRTQNTEESQMFDERRKQLEARLAAKRDARHSAMASYIARTGDAGKDSL